jgi:hypothetical protein
VPEIQAPSSTHKPKPYTAFSPSTPMNLPTQKPEEPKKFTCESAMMINETIAVRVTLCGQAQSHSQTRLPVGYVTAIPDEPEARGGTRDLREPKY